MNREQSAIRKHQLTDNNFFSISLLMLTLFFFSGCDGIKGKLLIMEANMQEAQSQHSNAISTYSEALRYTEAVPYAEYGLGVVYLFLGEDAAAFRRFDNALEMMDSGLVQRDTELQYRLHYNRGILYFHAENFNEAASEFRKALEIDESRIEAKRNLELSLLSMEQQHAALSSSSVDITENQGSDNTLFDYLRQKEVDSWKIPESSEDQESPWLDY